MKTLQMKLKEKKGFTLAELLIVVAIIAVLVAVSIPIFTSKLKDAQESTDLANIRAAKAVAVAAYLNNEQSLGVSQTESKTLYYDASSGELKTASSGIKVYGKSAAAVNGATGNPANNILQLVITKEGKVTLSWTAPAA